MRSSALNSREQWNGGMVEINPLVACNLQCQDCGDGSIVSWLSRPNVRRSRRWSRTNKTVFGSDMEVRGDL